MLCSTCSSELGLPCDPLKVKSKYNKKYKDLERERREAKLATSLRNRSSDTRKHLLSDVEANKEVKRILKQKIDMGDGTKMTLEQIGTTYSMYIGITCQTELKREGLGWMTPRNSSRELKSGKRLKVVPPIQWGRGKQQYLETEGKRGVVQWSGLLSRRTRKCLRPQKGEGREERPGRRERAAPAR